MNEQPTTAATKIIGARVILPSGCKILVGPQDLLVEEVARLIHLESDIGFSYCEYFTPSTQGVHHEIKHTVSALNH